MNFKPKITRIRNKIRREFVYNTLAFLFMTAYFVTMVLNLLFHYHKMIAMHLWSFDGQCWLMFMLYLLKGYSKEDKS